jgi:hypothetical protein
MIFNHERNNMKAVILALAILATPALATNGGGHDFGQHHDCNHEGGGKHDKHDKHDKKDKHEHSGTPKNHGDHTKDKPTHPTPATSGTGTVGGGSGGAIGGAGGVGGDSQATGGAGGASTSQSQGGNATGGNGTGGAGGNGQGGMGGASASNAAGGSIGDVGGSGSGNTTTLNTGSHTLFIPSHTQPAQSTTVPSATLTRTVDNAGCGVRQQLVRTPIYATISGFWRDKQVQNGENFELLMATDANGNPEPWKMINGEKFGHQVILDGAVLSQSSITGLSIGGNRGSGGGGSGSSTGGDALQQLASRIMLRDCPVTQSVKIEIRESVREVVREVLAKPKPKAKPKAKPKCVPCNTSLKLSNFMKGV